MMMMLMILRRRRRRRRRMLMMVVVVVVIMMMLVVVVVVVVMMMVMRMRLTHDHAPYALPQGSSGGRPLPSCVGPRGRATRPWCTAWQVVSMAANDPHGMTWCCIERLRLNSGGG
jgi:hypothetical protein